MLRLTAPIVAAAVLVVVGACGDFGEDPASSTDAAASSDGANPQDSFDGGPPIDVRDADTTVPPVAPKCVETLFGTPVRLPDPIPPKATCFIMSPKEDLAFYTVDRTLFSIPVLDDGFGEPKAINVFKTEYFGCVAFNATRSVLYHENFFRVFRQTFDETTGSFRDPQEVEPSGLDGTIGLLRPFFDPVRADLYVSVGRQVDFFRPPFGIARAPIRNDGTAGTFSVVNLGDEGAHNPVVSASSLSLYFASSTGSPAIDGGVNDDIWVATRRTTIEPFGSPARVKGVNSAFLDSPSYVSSDGCRLYFESTRESPGEPRLFVATRSP